MQIIGVIIALLLVGLFFYFIYIFIVGSIQIKIEERIDKTAPPEVQNKQREQAELEILQTMSREHLCHLIALSKNFKRHQTVSFYK